MGTSVKQQYQILEILSNRHAILPANIYGCQYDKHRCLFAHVHRPLHAATATGVMQSPGSKVSRQTFHGAVGRANL